MQAIQGYYDGVTIKPIGNIVAKPNQKVIITILDDFIEPERSVAGKGMRGILSQYADPQLAEREKGAWQRAAREKHGDT